MFRRRWLLWLGTVLTPHDLPSGDARCHLHPDQVSSAPIIHDLPIGDATSVLTRCPQLGECLPHITLLAFSELLVISPCHFPLSFDLSASNIKSENPITTVNILIHFQMEQLLFYA